ncbi:MAG: right-handed parallel beta-helix repeat-containing protein [Akkermansiaceae bacterium]|nr:right-handed parallel beta-helix repeat-containing protein [Akkermansiaceae bacterium]
MGKFLSMRAGAFFLGVYVAGNAGAVDYSILDFGATDGGADDLAAIHAAIAAASPGDRVLIPAGTFQISGPIVPKADVTLAGAGMDASILEYIGASSAPMVRIQAAGIDRVELTGFTLDGLGSSKATQGLEVSGTKDHHIHGIRVRNLVDASGFGPHGIYFSGAVTGSVIEGNEFLNIGVASTWGSGIRLNGGSNHTVVRQNLIQNVGRGGVLLSASTDCIITYNTVSQSGQTGPGLGVELWGGSHRGVVEDNNLDHWLSIDSSNMCAVRRNTVVANDGSIQYIGMEMAGGSDNVFTENHIGKGNHIGLSLSGNTSKTRSYFSNNIFSELDSWGAQIQDNGGVIRQLYFFNNTFEKANSDLPNLYGAPTVGFRFNAVAGGAGIRQLVFDGNQILANDHSGFAIYGHTHTQGVDELSFVNNTISNNGSNAIENGNVANLEWSGNTVSGNGNNNVPVSKGFANAKPTVQISGPMLVGVGETISFTLDYTDDGAPTPDAVLWDLGDGVPVTATSAGHVYQTPGDYTVALVAWDTQGRAAHATHTVTVVPLVDSDGDGLLDHHETLVYGTLPNDPDTDHDGYFDGAEITFRTNPKSSQETPEKKALITMVSATDLKLSFSCKLGSTYRIEQSNDLSAGSWQTVESGITGSGQILERYYTLPGAAQRLFYRMKQE